MDYSLYYAESYDKDGEDFEGDDPRLAEGQIVPKIKKAKKERHADWGKHGTVWYGPKGCLYLWQLCGDKIIRGWKRNAVDAENFTREAAYDNERTSPRVEIPRIIIETMRVETQGLTARDMALYWRLYAEARRQGITNPDYSVSMSALMAYLGVKSVDRVRQSLNRIGDAFASYRFAYSGCHGTKTLPLVDVDFHADEGQKLKSTHVITFRLPPELIGAIGWSRDYAWVDINALTRFESRFTIPLYFHFCLRAGMLARRRKPIEVGEVELRKMVGLPEKMKPSAFKEAVNLILGDLSGIFGVRKRFEYTIESWKEESDGKLGFYFEIGNAAKNLKRVKAAPISDATHEKIALERLSFPIEPHQLPSLWRFRQAATLVNRPVATVYSQWLIEVFGATRKHVTHVIGHTAADFLTLINEAGVEAMFENWCDKRDFGVPISLKSADSYDPVKDNATSSKSQNFEHAARYEADAYDEDDEQENLSCGDDFGDEALDVLY